MENHGTIYPKDAPSHQLHHAWTFWYVRRVQGSKATNYENNIKMLGSFDTVEGFWNYYSHLVRPNELPVTSDYLTFKKGIKPMWEDDANRKGGKWIVRLRKGLASRYWEELLLAVVGEQFDVGEDEICGVAVSIRFQEDILSVWNKNADDLDAKARIQDRMRRIFYSVPNVVMEYKPHEEALKVVNSLN
mmetsp:Transcript_4226/g.5918  ORF Transcript_4226/g.5918 Transcript_4226/m.5918 type:complete len:189 (+) Transcript_4226:74-640(+)|eukprot:CAMPEP_0168546460 /NCGR_PEP_ID=MMETSP0413-20121227/3511_1 /TAXON_ID=136452 /ORGANISM="Filamoeba nolandi, Strain NC-AS-23-1" /LENGTH=188 /DNA_ID=CAMNT_0008576641 /DNA_START=40 /DNA_END=606 /DNA_ORIENTATION=+